MKTLALHRRSAKTGKSLESQQCLTWILGNYESLFWVSHPGLILWDKITHTHSFLLKEIQLWFVHNNNQTRCLREQINRLKRNAEGRRGSWNLGSLAHRKGDFSWRMNRVLITRKEGGQNSSRERENKQRCLLFISCLSLDAFAKLNFPSLWLDKYQ